MNAFRLLNFSRWLIASVFMGLACSQVGWAQTRVFNEGTLPSDRRLENLKDLNGYFPFEVPTTKAAWEARAEKLRKRILVSTGLWPLPEKTPLNAKIYGKTKRDGFQVEKVHFESFPGHYVTGLLFRPEGPGKNRPAVLSPHGHGGRLYDYGENAMPKLIATGAERYEKSGRFPKQARCAQLARMGCVVFIYDMEGYADSQQLSYELVHRFAKQRGDQSANSWGFFSPQAELRLQNVMGIQTWNSIRALEFLCSLPDVDTNRIGVTGGSGGGTQTILLCAIDDRPTVAFPQGMVSTSMQGGCTCENCSLLRIGTGNVELAALFAPKPQAMTAANDWTKDMMTKGFPELKELYGLYNKENQVKCDPLLQFPHNYNIVTRELMYQWMNKHLKLGIEEPIIERDFEPLTTEQLTVWDEEHPQPPGGETHERKLTRYLAEQSEKQIPEIATSWKAYQEVVGEAWETLIGRSLPKHQELTRTKIDKQKRAGYWYFEDAIKLDSYEEQLPVISLYPLSTEWNGQVVIWVDGDGKAALFDQQGEPKPQVRRLLDAGVSVVTADVFLQGEFLAGQNKVTQQRVVKNPREFAGFTYGYNHPLFAQRVHDLLTLITFVSGDDHQPKGVHLFGTNGMGPHVAAARVIAKDTIRKAAVETDGFRFANIDDYRDVNFLPGAVKYHDVPGLLALSAPHPLFVAGEKELPKRVTSAYQAAGAPKAIQSAGDRQDSLQAAIDWLLETN